MDELTEKRHRLLALLQKQGLDAICLNRVANFAWYTGGLEPVVMLSSDRAEASLLITPDRQSVLCNSVEHPRLRDEDQLGRLGYDFCVWPWYAGVPGSGNLVQGKRWGSDWPLPGAVDLSPDIARLRYQLSAAEVERYRSVGQRTAQALERAARAVRPGMTEVQIAGLIAAEAWSEGVTPTLLLVGADERIFRYRHPIPTSRSLEGYAMLVICGRHRGLVASATRFVHFGPLPDELGRKQSACAYVDATFNAATRVGARVADIFALATQAYAEMGFPDEWQKHNQGGSAGYESRDYEGTPTCEETVLAEQGFAWNPSITGVKSEDTIVVHEGSIEFLTQTDGWPMVRTRVDGRDWDRPAILIR
jgi:antitoxin VapB